MIICQCQSILIGTDFIKISRNFFLLHQKYIYLLSNDILALFVRQP